MTAVLLKFIGTFSVGFLLRTIECSSAGKQWLHLHTDLCCEDGGSMLLRNVGTRVPTSSVTTHDHYTDPHTTETLISYTLSFDHITRISTRKERITEINDAIK